VHEFPCNQGAVLALVAKDDTIYAACQDGYVRVFDLETKTLVRTIIVQEVNLNSLTSNHLGLTKPPTGHRHPRDVDVGVGALYMFCKRLGKGTQFTPLLLRTLPIFFVC